MDAGVVMKAHLSCLARWRSQGHRFGQRGRTLLGLFEVWLHELEAKDIVPPDADIPRVKICQAHLSTAL